MLGSRHLNAALLHPLAERWQGRAIAPKLRRLREEARAPVAVRRLRQRERLAAMLRHAGARVPYYRDLFAKTGFDPEGLADDSAGLAALPTLDKAIIATEGPRLLAEGLEPGRLHVRPTSGSTGPAVAIRYSDEALDWTAAVHRFVREWVGKHAWDREAHLSTAPGESFPWRDRAKEAVKCAALNRTNLPMARYDEAELGRLWRRLEAVRPDLLQGHPSSVHALALHTGQGVSPFRVFESTGERLDPAKRRTIEERLGCSVVDRYGSAEFGVVAYERPGAARPGMEILDAVVFAETAPDGELLLTGLLNDAMPLVRYRTGDLARIACDEDEVAGRIVEIEGRVHDWVRVGRDRLPTHVIQDRLDRLGIVQDFQIRLDPGGRPTLHVALPEGADAAQRERVAGAVHGWWGDALPVVFTPLPDFVRGGRSGKFRYVVPAEAGA